MTRLWHFVGCVALMYLACGCSTMVRVDSVPSGAELFIDGQSMGTTPWQGELSGATVIGSSRIFELRYPGFRTVRGTADWQHDPKHLFWLALAWFPPSQLIHLHPMQHRRLKNDYVIILEENPSGDTTADQRLVYGRNTDSVTADDSQAAAAP